MSRVALVVWVQLDGWFEADVDIWCGWCEWREHCKVGVKIWCAWCGYLKWVFWLGWMQ